MIHLFKGRNYSNYVEEVKLNKGETVRAWEKHQFCGRHNTGPPVSGTVASVCLIPDLPPVMFRGLPPPPRPSVTGPESKV